MTDFFVFVSEQWLLVSGFLLLLYAFIFYESHKAGKQVGHHEVTRLLNGGTGVVIDIRDGSEYRKGHIAGAIHIPFAEVEKRLGELESRRDKVLVIADKLGQHSANTAKALKRAGFDTRRLRGGMAEWADQNLPVVRD